jgi:hypothetical protein
MNPDDHDYGYAVAEGASAGIAHALFGAAISFLTGDALHDDATDLDDKDDN